jgi:hypothetical protein
MVLIRYFLKLLKNYWYNILLKMLKNVGSIFYEKLLVQHFVKMLVHISLKILVKSFPLQKTL